MAQAHQFEISLPVTQPIIEIKNPDLVHPLKHLRDASRSSVIGEKTSLEFAGFGTDGKRSTLISYIGAIPANRDSTALSITAIPLDSKLETGKDNETDLLISRLQPNGPHPLRQLRTLWKASNASVTTASTYMSGLGSDLAYAIGWVGGGVLCLVAEANIWRWLRKQERWIAQDVDVNALTKEESDDIRGKLEDLMRPSGRLFLSRRGYPARIYARAFDLVDKITDRVENKHDWTLLRSSWRIKHQVELYWLEPSREKSMAHLVYALATANHFLDYAHGEKTFMAQANALVREEIVTAVCDAFAATTSADAASEGFRLCFFWLAEIFKRCGGDVFRTIVDIDDTAPFLARFVRICAAYFSSIHPFELEKPTFGYFVDVLIPLAKFSPTVREASAHILPTLGHLPILKLYGLLSAIENAA